MMKGLLSDEQNNRLEAIELERTLHHMMDAVYCPRCSTISIEDGDNCAQCSKCYYTFCSLCNEGWHPGTQCLTPQDKLELMRRRMEGSKSGEQEFRKREAELQSLAHIQVQAEWHRCRIWDAWDLLVALLTSLYMLCRNCKSTLLLVLCGRHARIMAFVRGKNAMPCLAWHSLLVTCAMQHKMLCSHEKLVLMPWCICQLTCSFVWSVHRVILFITHGHPETAVWLSLQKTCKQCPACGMAIERSEGCNKMTCGTCGAFFCYKCNQQIEGYKHYWNGNCVLFDLTEIQRWEHQMGQQMM